MGSQGSVSLPANPTIQPVSSLSQISSSHHILSFNFSSSRTLLVFYSILIMYFTHVNNVHRLFIMFILCMIVYLQCLYLV